MKITLNNNPETFPEDKLTINEVLERKNFTFKMLVIKLNGTLVQKTDYNETSVKDGDDLNVLHLISGG
jgi:thiamine biosynthesis protein ThiS